MPKEYGILNPAFTLLFIAISFGCGRSGIERVTVSGTVTYKGQPVQYGQVRFRPCGDTKGPSAGAFIVDGKYVAEGNGGVPVGAHRVEITARRRDPRHADGDNDRGTVTTQYLPDKYNRTSTLSITIPSGSKPVVQNFDL